MNRTRDIDAILRSLDPAGEHVDVDSVRARADLRAILATDPTPPSLGRPLAPRTALGRPRAAGTPARRLVLVGGLVAAVTGGMVLLPSLLGGDQAFATWTAAPAGLSTQQRAEAAADCRTQQRGAAGDRYADDLRSAEPVIAESRGVWTTVVLAGPDGFSAMCISDDSARLFAQGMIGSLGTPTDYTAPLPREVRATDLGVGTMSVGDISLAAGTVGADVAGVMLHSRTHGDVSATVTDGHFALWFPGDELIDASSTGVEVEVTFRDGTTGTSWLSL